MYARLFQIVLVFVFSTSVRAEHISDILKKISDADAHLNYQGVFVMRRSDNLTTMKVEHGVDSKRGVWESLESLNGESRRVVRNNDEVISIFPERKAYTISHRTDKATLHPTLPENLDKLKRHYRIEHVASDRIAGRKTSVLEVKPLDKFRYGYRYWLDNETGVLLKCDSLNEKNEVVEQMMFTTLKYLKTLPEDAFKDPAVEGYKKRDLDAMKKYVKKVKWKVSDLPQGFMLTQSSIHKHRKMNSLQMVYSDGLASVSVFIEGRTEKPAGHIEGLSSIGALNAYGTSKGEHFVTVVGEVPAKTVKTIAESAVQAP